MFSFIAKLKKQLPESDWPIVSSSLRLQAEIWHVLQEQEFGQLALEKAGHDFSKWNPAFLAKLYINNLGELANEIFSEDKSTSDQLHFAALALFEKLKNHPEELNEKLGIGESLLLSLAVNERFKLSQDQSSFMDDIAHIPEKITLLFLSCLMGIFPDLEILLTMLLNKAPNVQVSTKILQAYFSQPLKDAQRAKNIQNIGNSLPDSAWLSLLKQIEVYKPEISRQLANKSLSRFKQPDAKLSQYKQLEQMKLESDALMLSDRNEEALVILSQAWDSGQRLQADLAAKLASSAENSDDRVVAIAALEQAAQLDPSNHAFRTKILAGKISKGRIKHKSLPAKTGNHPEPLFSAAKIAAKNGKNGEARELLQSAWKSLKSAQNLQKFPKAQEFSEKLVKLMLQLEMLPLATEVSEVELAKYPNSPSLANSLASAQIASEENELALQSAHLAVALSPKDQKYRKTLASILQALGNFDEAINEWDFIFENQDSPTESNLLSLSQCLFESGQYERCETYLTKLLNSYPENALGHLLQGHLYMQINNKKAAHSFEKAIKFDPSNEEGWLELSFCKQKDGEIKEALNILSEAKTLFVHSAKLFVQLASLFKVANQSNKAIDTLIEAKSLLDITVQQKINETVYFELGTLQLENDQIDAAVRTFSEAFAIFPSNYKISWAYGKTLLLKEEPEKALSPLIAANLINLEHSEIQLDLCAAYIGAEKDLATAENILSEYIVEYPSSEIAAILFAECQLAMGNTEKAFSQFTKLSKISNTSRNPFKHRIQIGLANCLMAKENYKDAITTLESLKILDPSNLEVLQNLCKAYSLDNKTQEAFQIANHLYLSSDKNEKVYRWFARQAKSLAYFSEARDALEEASQKYPSNENFRIDLAKLLWENDHASEAKSIFEKQLTSSLISIENLTRISEYLKTHGNIKLAARFIEKAIELSDQSDPELFRQLSDIFINLKNSKKSIIAIDKAITLAPQNPKYILRKVALLENAKQIHAALENLEKAITLLPKNGDLKFRKSQLLNDQGNKLKALSAAEEGLNLISSPKNAPLKFSVQLALDGLNYDRARRMIANEEELSDEIICADIIACFEMGQDIEAAQRLALLNSSSSDTAQVNALIAQLELSKGDLLAANRVYKKALRQIGKSFESDFDNNFDANTLFSVARSGELLQDWDSSIRILAKLKSEYPNAARYSLTLAKVLIKQYEWSKICEASQIVNDAPKIIKDNISLLTEITEMIKHVAGLAPQADLKHELAHEVMRARLRLDPENISKQLPEIFPSNEKQAAALVAATKHNELLVGESQKIIPFAKSGHVMIEMAISNLSTDPNRAFAFAKQAVEKQAQNPAFLAIEAFSAAASGNLSQAIKSIEQALAMLPNQARWHAFLGNCLINSGDSVAALPHLELAVKLESNNPAHHFNHGLLQQDSHNYRAAITSFRKSIEINGKQVDAYTHLANSLIEVGDIQSADTETKNLFKHGGRNTDYLMLRAKLSAEHSQLDKALNLIKEAAELSSEKAEIYGQWSELMVSKGNFDNALTLCLKAAKIAKDAIPWKIKSIRIKALIDNKANLGKDLNILLERHPNNPQIAIAVAESLANEGNIEEAKKTLQKAIKNGKSLSIFEQAELHRFFAKTLKINGQLDQTIAELEKSAELAGHVVDTHLEMGHVFLARRQRHSALKAFEKACEADPSSPEPYLQLAQLFKNSKDYAKAEKALRHATELAPNDASIQRHLAAVMTLNLVHQPQSLGVSS